MTTDRTPKAGTARNAADLDTSSPEWKARWASVWRNRDPALTPERAALRDASDARATAIIDRTFAQARYDRAQRAATAARATYDAALRNAAAADEAAEAHAANPVPADITQTLRDQLASLADDIIDLSILGHEHSDSPEPYDQAYSHLRLLAATLGVDLAPLDSDTYSEGAALDRIAATLTPDQDGTDSEAYSALDRIADACTPSQD